MPLKLNDVFRVVDAEYPIQGLHRVLWTRSDEEREVDLVVIIEIPARSEGGASPRYWRGPARWSLRALNDALAAGRIAVINLDLPALVHMTDDEIRRRFPKRKGATVRRNRTDCAMLQGRDRDLAWIEPLVTFIRQNPADAFETDVLIGMKAERLKETKAHKAGLNNALNRWLALACGPNSLLSAAHRCGAAGKPRALRKCVKLGRKSMPWLAGKVPSPGIHLNDDDKARIQLGRERYLLQGLSVQEAYAMTMGAWWSSGVRLVDGRAVPELLPMWNRPTPRQFSYWGTKGQPEKAAFRLLLGEGKWEQRFRPKTGSSLDIANAVGQVAFLDGTSTDVSLAASHSALQSIGTCHRIMVQDGFSEVICGFYCGIEAPSGQTALLSIFNAVSDKVEFCRRFGITIKGHEIPAVFHREYVADNGELRNERSKSALRTVGSAIEYVERLRAERKGPVEGGHKSIHRILDHHVEGTTHGRQRERGEEHSAISACWNWFDYVRALIRAIIYYNCEADALALMRRHPFRQEMARDRVPATRIAIYEWCVKHGRVAMPALNIEFLRAHLMPSIPAVVKQNGVFLLRPDRGDKPELIHGHRFTGPRMMELGWHQGQQPSRRIEVRYDPHDLKCIWYVDELGLHRLDNVSRDFLHVETATLDDSLVLQDDETLGNLLRRHDREQAQSDLVTLREDKNLQRRKEKDQAIKNSDERVKKSSLTAHITENRKAEAQLLARQLDPIERAPLEQLEPIGEIEPEIPAPVEVMSEQDVLAPFRARRRAE